jgi:prepilin-type N-terminal cleavage/methylation domain-containing protein
VLKKPEGFTIVELLIAIVIVAYNGIKEKAQETSVTHDLGNIAKQVELYKIDLGRYPSTSDMQTLKIRVNKDAYGVNPTGATGFYCVDSSGSRFSIVTRVKSLMILKYSSIDGRTGVYSGSQTAPQLCTDSGVPSASYLAFTQNGQWNSWIDN